MHAQWLNNVLGRYACEQVVQKDSPLHEQDFAQLISTHFSDVLQQIQDRDKMTGDSEDDDEAIREEEKP